MNQKDTTANDEYSKYVNRMRSKNAISIRRAGLADCSALGAFLEHIKGAETERFFNPFPLVRETAYRILRDANRDEYYLASCEDRIIGLALLRGFDEGYAVPSFGVVVDGDFRRRGVGDALIKHVLDRTIELGCDKVRLSVYRENRGAIELYRRHGFDIDVGETAKAIEAGINKVIMFKKNFVK